MDYVILDKETEEMIDLINLSPEEKLNYEKANPNHFLRDLEEEELLLQDSMIEFEEDYDSWEDDDESC